MKGHTATLSCQGAKSEIEYERRKGESQIVRQYMQKPKHAEQSRQVGCARHTMSA